MVTTAQKPVNGASAPAKKRELPYLSLLHTTRSPRPTRSQAARPRPAGRSSRPSTSSCRARPPASRRRSPSSTTRSGASVPISSRLTSPITLPQIQDGHRELEQAKGKGLNVTLPFASSFVPRTRLALALRARIPRSFPPRNTVHPCAQPVPTLAVRCPLLAPGLLDERSSGPCLVCYGIYVPFTSHCSSVLLLPMRSFYGAVLYSNFNSAVIPRERVVTRVLSSSVVMEPFRWKTNVI